LAVNEKVIMSEAKLLISRQNLIITVAAFVAMSSPLNAEEQATADLAAAAQNPVANMISLPLQNNTLFGIGPGDDTGNVLNIQPVIPVNVGEWNIVTRTIVPLIYVPDLTEGLPDLPEGADRGSTFGLGDINFTAFLSPAKPGALIWGIGPSFGLRTATSDRTGSGKWTVGPSAVLLSTPKPWVFGLLVRNLWSYAGDGDRADVNQFLAQPFINYNLPKGWYLTTSPIVTANWEADNDERWTVPIGGGFGKIFSLGTQPMNAQVQSFYNVEHPKFGPDWSLRFQLQFLFPQ
jgi:hypothetical protein